ncbi:hypothetical protein A2U01_0064107, partial [Trifolium medium]|nr:hypothetical protein [Trifolium medium]
KQSNVRGGDEEVSDELTSRRQSPPVTVSVLEPRGKGAYHVSEGKTQSRETIERSRAMVKS